MRNDIQSMMKLTSDAHSSYAAAILKDLKDVHDAATVRFGCTRLVLRVLPAPVMT